jgi:hypothetical protein
MKTSTDIAFHLIAASEIVKSATAQIPRIGRADLAIGMLNVIEIHEKGLEKSAGIFDWIGKALPYAGQYLKAAPTRIGGWWNKMRGGKALAGAAEKGLAAESPEVAAALAQRAKGTSALAGANKELFGSSVPKFDPATGKRIWGGMRGEVSNAFNAMPKWQQNTVKGLGWAGTTAGTIALGPGSVGGQIHSYISGKEGELSGARQAQDMAAQAAKQLQNMPLMDRLKLGLGTVFSPTSTGEGIGNFIQSIGRPPGWTPPQTAPGVRSPSSTFTGAAPRASAAVNGMS